MDFPKGFEVSSIGGEETTVWHKVVFEKNTHRKGGNGEEITRRETLISRLGGNPATTETAKYVAPNKVASFSAYMLHSAKIILMPPGGISILPSNKNQGYATQVQSILVHVARVTQYALFAGTVADTKLKEELMRRGYIFLPDISDMGLEIFVHSTALEVGYILPENRQMPTGAYKEMYNVILEH